MPGLRDTTKNVPHTADQMEGGTVVLGPTWGNTICDVTMITFTRWVGIKSTTTTYSVLELIVAWDKDSAACRSLVLLMFFDKSKQANTL